MNDPIILDSNRLRAYFDSIARDFQTTPQQMAAFTIILLAMLTGLVLLARYQRCVWCDPLPHAKQRP